MAKYINVTSTSTTLLTKNTQYTGNISSVHVSNNSSSDVEIKLSLYDGVKTEHFYFVKNLVIPTGVSLLLDDNLSFNISKYDLVITTTASPDLTIIIK